MKAIVTLALALALAACEETPYVTTPLDGGTACGASSCGAGEVCVEEFLPGREPNPTRCFAPPDDCYVFDCAGEKCAPCMRAQCAPLPVAIVDRTVFCEVGVAR